MLDRQQPEVRVVVGGFDDHLVRAHPIHPREQANFRALGATLDAQRRKLVGHDAHRPALSIWGRARRAHCIDLRRSPVFPPLTEGAPIKVVDLDAFVLEVGWARGALCGDDHPAP